MSIKPRTTPVATQYAWASLILSLAAVFVGLFGCIPAIVFGHLALRQPPDEHFEVPLGLAHAGIIIGWIGVVLSLIIMLIVVWQAHSELDQVFETMGTFGEWVRHYTKPK